MKAKKIEQLTLENYKEFTTNEGSRESIRLWLKHASNYDLDLWAAIWEDGALTKRFVSREIYKDKSFDVDAHMRDERTWDYAGHKA